MATTSSAAEVFYRDACKRGEADEIGMGNANSFDLYADCKSTSDFTNG